MLLLSLSAWGQTSAGPYKQRISSLSKQLQYDRTSKADYQRFRESRDAVTDQIRVVVDEWVGQLPESSTAAEVRQTLSDLLAEHRYTVESIGSPFARVMDVPSGRCLLISYLLVRGDNDPVVTVRGYRWEKGGFHLIAATDSDFVRYTLSTLELNSPVTGQV